MSLFSQVKIYALRCDPAPIILQLCKLVQELEENGEHPEIRWFDPQTEGFGFIQHADFYQRMHVRNCQGLTFFGLGWMERKANPSIVRSRLARMVKKHPDLATAKQIQEWKEDIVVEVRKTHPKINVSTAIVAISDTGLVFINKSSPTFCEDVLGSLRALTGSLPVVEFLPGVGSYMEELRRDVIDDREFLSDTWMPVGWVEMTNGTRTLRDTDPTPFTDVDSMNFLIEGYGLNKIRVCAIDDDDEGVSATVDYRGTFSKIQMPDLDESEDLLLDDCQDPQTSKQLNQLADAMIKLSALAKLAVDMKRTFVDDEEVDNAG